MPAPKRGGQAIRRREIEIFHHEKPDHGAKRGRVERFKRTDCQGICNGNTGFGF